LPCRRAARRGNAASPLRAQHRVIDGRDAARALRDANINDPNILPLPWLGNDPAKYLGIFAGLIPVLDPLDVQNAEYAFM